MTLTFLRSFFVDPCADNKGSMTRLCTLILSVAVAIAVVKGHDAAGAISALGAFAMSATRAKAA